MMLRIRLVAALLVFVTALLHPAITQAAAAMKYTPDSTACNKTYKTISVAQDKTVTLTCPAAQNTNATFDIKYANGSAGCSAYSTIETNTANKTVTINCATATQLFKIVPSPTSIAQNGNVHIKVSRQVPNIGNDTLTLTIPNSQGYFVTPGQTTTTVKFEDKSPDDVDVVATITASSGNVAVTVIGANTGGIVVLSVAVAEGCGSTPVNTIVIGVGELVLREGTNQLRQSVSDARWRLKAKETLAIQFTLNATEPTNKMYGFRTYDAVPLTNFPKQFSLSRCPGVFENLPLNCELKQTSGIDEFLLLTPNYKNRFVGCQLDSLIGTYYWNIKTIDQTLVETNVFIVNVNE
jgi:hypothetical protein